MATASPSVVIARVDQSGALTFETSGAAGLIGWDGLSGGPAGTLFVDSTVVHGGRYAGRIQRSATSPSTFSVLTLHFPVNFSGDTLELRGWLKSQGVRVAAGLLQRQDDRTGQVRRFDNMNDRPIQGTLDWSEVRVALPLDPHATTVHLGALLIGEGTLWVDDLRLFVDGRPMTQVPELVRAKTALETDTTFNAGSGFVTTRVTSEQLDNLMILARVWGFLKYHHPAIISGKRHWDYELFRVIPRVMTSTTRLSAQSVLAAWVDSLGTVQPCARCAKDPTGRPITPSVRWLEDQGLLGEHLSAQLRHIYANRPVSDGQSFVGLNPVIRNPDFSGEAPHLKAGVPDPGYRLLALFRCWNAIQYWYPYRDLIQDWEGVLRASTPRVLAAESEDEYTLALLEVIGRIPDGHAGLRGGPSVRPPRGEALAPVTVRFIEGAAVVSAYSDPVKGPASGLEIGDVILAIDGTRVDSLVAQWRPYYAASNEIHRLHLIAGVLTCGPPGSVVLTVERAGRRFERSVERVLAGSLDVHAWMTHDQPGETFRRLSDDVAYLKLSSVNASAAVDYVTRAEGAKCLVIDIRNYPSEFMVFELGQHLVSNATPFVRFTIGDLSNPGAFDWTEPIAIEPKLPRFEGRIAILVDETTMSQAEYTAMAFRASPGAIVVGSTTAGADGNVSTIRLPGRISARFTGIGVFYPDKACTQGVGIVPDVESRQTIAGVRAGRDEVLETAIREVMGREVTEVESAALKR